MFVGVVAASFCSLARSERTRMLCYTNLFGEEE